METKQTMVNEICPTTTQGWVTQRTNLRLIPAPGSNNIDEQAIRMMKLK